MEHIRIARIAFLDRLKCPTLVAAKLVYQAL